jgi:hypothetical protein
MLHQRGELVGNLAGNAALLRRALDDGRPLLEGPRDIASTMPTNHRETTPTRIAIVRGAISIGA